MGGEVIGVGGSGRWPESPAEVYERAGETPAVVAMHRNREALLSGFEEERRARVEEVLRRLLENLVRLHWRYEECQQAVATIPPGYSGPKLPEFQLRFVDKTEALHQHVYATLAVLALVLNHRREGDSRQPYPVGSITKFLAALKERDFRYKDRLLDHVAVLERSADFRSKYVDHPEQHQLHDWMTYCPEEKAYIIYFIRKSGALIYRAGPTDPFHPGFQPPVDCGDDFYVSPDPERTYSAMQKVVIAALRINESR